jgi:hypothetical protein
VQFKKHKTQWLSVKQMLLLLESLGQAVEMMALAAWSTLGKFLNENLPPCQADVHVLLKSVLIFISRHIPHGFYEKQMKGKLLYTPQYYACNINLPKF